MSFPTIRTVVVFGLLCILSPVTQAAPLEITGGYLDWNATFSVSGPSFTWEGAGDSPFGSCPEDWEHPEPYHNCFDGRLFIFPEFAQYSSKLTVGGVEYDDPPNDTIMLFCIGSCHFFDISEGPGPLPDRTEKDSFDMAGYFYGEESFEFRGHGVVTYTLRHVPMLTGVGAVLWGWEIDTAHFEFAGPVPEPSTTVLLMIGIAGTAVLGRCARRRQRRR